jgi:hypothetical protein
VPDTSTLDPMALVLAFAATVALTRVRLPIPALLFVSAGTGLALGLVRAAS